MYTAVIFDTNEVVSRRREIIANYKANRLSPPPVSQHSINAIKKFTILCQELEKQFKLIPTANEALNITSIYATECEAYDLIASYTKEALDAGHRVKELLCTYIFTNGKKVIIVGDDKDLLQLVSPQVSLYNPQVCNY